MNYQKIYDALVEKAKVRGLDKSSVDYYTEIHHIVPRSLGGSDEYDNLVMLSAREHYIAHLLLWKRDKSCHKMACAFMYMSSRQRNNSRLYHNFKNQFSKVQSERFYQKEKDLTGQKFGMLTVQSLNGWVARKANNLAQWACKCDCGGEILVVSSALASGNTRSCGCLIEEYKNNRGGIKNPFFGKSHSENTKEAISSARLAKDIKPWETPNAMYDDASLIKWALADVYHDLWVEFDKPSRRKLRNIYNEAFSDDVEPDYFKNQVKKFSEGFNPVTDNKWKSFREKYLSGNWIYGTISDASEMEA